MNTAPPRSCCKPPASNRRGQAGRRGAVAILVAIFLAAFLATVAFSLDIARIHLMKAELHASTDAAAKAAVTTLGLSQDLAAARQAAKDIAAANLVAGKPLVLEDQDIVFGNARPQGNGTLQFVAGATPYGAVRIDGRKLQSSPSGNLDLFFGGVLGATAFDTDQVSIAARLDRDICLVVDRSGSMAGRKMIDLKSAVAMFLDTVAEPNQRPLVGLVSFSTNATLNQSLTSNYLAVQLAATRLSADGWTNIGAAINTGRTALAGGHNPQFSQKTMVLMTDGRHNQATSPEDAAAQALAANIVIHTVTFGDDADQPRMRAIAEMTGGTFRHASTGTDLREAFRQIAETIRTSLIQ